MEMGTFSKVKITPALTGLGNLAALINEANWRNGVVSNYTEESFTVVGVLEKDDGVNNTVVWLRGSGLAVAAAEAEDGQDHYFEGDARFAYTRVDLGEIVLPVPEPHITQEVDTINYRIIRDAMTMAALVDDQVTFRWATNDPPQPGMMRELIAEPVEGIANVLYKPGTQMIFKVYVNGSIPT